MFRIILGTFLFLFLLLSCTDPAGVSGPKAPAPAVDLVGRVVNLDGVPISGVVAKLLMSGISDTTDTTGQFSVFTDNPEFTDTTDSLLLLKNGQRVFLRAISQLHDTLEDMTLKQHMVKTGINACSELASQVSAHFLSRDTSPLPQQSSIGMRYSDSADAYIGTFYMPFVDSQQLWDVFVESHDSLARLTGRSDTMLFSGVVNTITLSNLDACSALPRVHAEAPASVATGDSFVVSGNGRDLQGGFIQLYEWDVGATGTFQYSTTDSVITVQAPAQESSGLLSCVVRVTDNDGNYGFDTVVVSLIERSGRMFKIAAKDTSFLMGNSRGAWNEKPEHLVTFTYDFWMDSTEVTKAVYSSVMGQAYSDFQPPWEEPLTGTTGMEPVTEVNFYDAILYCNTLTKQSGSADTAYTYAEQFYSPGNGSFLEGLEIDIHSRGFRLPTEAEWEYACRAGTSTNYYWRGTGSSFAWFKGNSGGTLHPVAQKKPNAFRLYDMSGNVREWCNDRYGAYPDSSVQDPTGSRSGSFRVVRGGSFVHDMKELQSSRRDSYGPGSRTFEIGFRVVRRAE